MGSKNTEPVQIPSELSSLTDEELGTLEESIHAEFAQLDSASDDDISSEALERMAVLADAADAVTGQRTARAEELAARSDARNSLRTRMTPPEGDGDNAPVGGDAVDDEDDDVDASVESGTETREPAMVAGGRGKTDVRDVLKDRHSNLNARLRDARRYQPQRSKIDPSQAFAQSVLVASADIAGFATGGKLNNMLELVRAMQTRARALPDSRMFSADGDWTRVPRYPVASMQRSFRHTVDLNSPLSDIWSIMQDAADPSALVAAGGWCSPSEIRYDFYNIATIAGAIDIPTIGVSRGGIKWPTSPSFGSLASSTGLWHWTETQDTAAATGTDQSGTKTCARVPCASFNEARLEFEGVCITAGNLTTDAWPEQLANFMRLVEVAHARRMNAWYINSLVSQSTAVSLCATGIGVAVPILDGIEMQAIDMRAKYGMDDDDVLECKMPSWVMGVIRADLAKRTGLDPDKAFNISNAEIAGWMTSRRINLQLVQDWQVRATGMFGDTTAITAWPTSITYLMYPAGTFVRGSGLSLDFGVIRDSTLNATNDYTAAWSEESMLTAMIGHESRVITTPLCPNGAVGAAISFACTDC